jgi:hypothetical protein
VSEVSSSLRGTLLLRPTELEVFVRSPLADGGVRIDAETSALRFNVDRSVVHDLESMFSRAGLQWNRDIDSDEHVWRAPTGTRAPSALQSRRRPPRIINNWRTVLPPPQVRARADATHYNVSLLAKSVVVALGAPKAPVAEIRAEAVCGTASGHTRSQRDCTRIALSIAELVMVSLDSERDQLLFAVSGSAATTAPASPPPTARSIYSTPSALDRTAYGTPLGRSFVAPTLGTSRLGADAMRLDSPFVRHTTPSFDDRHLSRDAARGAALPFQAEQPFLSPTSSVSGTPSRLDDSIDASTPSSALSAFRRAGGRMYTDLRAPALTLSFVEVRVRDASSMLPSVKLALSFEGVREVYNNRAFASRGETLRRHTSSRCRQRRCDGSISRCA